MHKICYVELVILQPKRLGALQLTPTPSTRGCFPLPYGPTLRLDVRAVFATSDCGLRRPLPIPRPIATNRANPSHCLPTHSPASPCQYDDHPQTKRRGSRTDKGTAGRRAGAGPEPHGRDARLSFPPNRSARSACCKPASAPRPPRASPLGKVHPLGRQAPAGVPVEDAGKATHTGMIRINDTAGFPRHTPPAERRAQHGLSLFGIRSGADL